MRKFIIGMVLIIFCAVSIYPHQETKSLSLSAEGISNFHIECGAGYLRIQGDTSLKIIKVEAEIILEGRNEKSAQEYMQKHMVLELTKSGNRAVLKSYFKDNRNLFSWRNKVINLTVHMPENLALRVDDGSGRINIRGISSDIVVKDGSGDIDIADIKGDIELDDGSGDIDLTDVQGEIDVDDSSGGIAIKNIQGSVAVNDGSGSMEIRGITGDVRVSDGSGSINISDVDGNFYLEDDGSGSVRVHNIKGKIIK